MSQLDLIAGDLPVGERTLRRGLAQGLVHGERLGPRRVRIAPAEELYLVRYWPLLGQLRQLLRTERRVRLAVLFGSVARGQDGPGSDVDILVTTRDGDGRYLYDLEARLTEAMNRDVQLAQLESAERDPSMMADVLDDGRVLVDRDGEWAELRARAEDVHRAAERAEKRLLEEESEYLSFARDTPAR
jgi:predicted nucleotidyltransferase